MYKVISQKDEISVSSLTERLKHGEALTVVYKAKSVSPYYAFLSRTSHFKFGFRSPVGIGNKMTYMADTLEESIQSAINGGKEVFVFERDELCKLFNF